MDGRWGEEESVGERESEGGRGVDGRGKERIWVEKDRRVWMERENERERKRKEQCG